MKKILIITEVFYPENFIINDVLSDWVNENKSVIVLTRVPSYPKGFLYDGFENKLFSKSTYLGVTIYHIPFIKGYQSSNIRKALNYVNYTFWSFWFLIWHGREFDRLFIYQTGPLTNALSATLLKSIYRWKIIIWTQDLWPETVYAFGIKKTFYIETFLNALVKFIYRNCDEILVSCNGFIPRLKKLIHQGNFYWIPNWTLTDNYSTQKVELKGKFNFTFAGNVGKVQNLRNVLLAFKNISDKNPDVYFNVIGDGSYLLELKDIVDSNLIRNVVFHGQQPLNLMPSYYKSSDVLVLSLINEPLYQIMIPSKFQSYLNAKKPIFSIVNGELNNLVNDYNIGFTADSGEISSISNGFHSFIQLGSDQLKEMSVNSNILQTEYFDRSEVLKKLQNIVFK